MIDGVSGIFMGYLWDIYGIFMGYLLDIHGIFMGLPSGKLTVCELEYHRDS
jgi:hypothetical protein